MQNAIAAARNVSTLHDVYLIRHNNGYVGHGNCMISPKPVVFSFRHPTHATEVAHKMNRKHCTIMEYAGNAFIIQESCTDPYKTTIEDDGTIMYGQPRPELFTECYGVLNAHIHLSMNNVNMQIIDTMIEGDEGELYLMSSTKPPTPLFINDDMIKIHLDRLLRIEAENN